VNDETCLSVTSTLMQCLIQIFIVFFCLIVFSNSLVGQVWHLYTFKRLNVEKKVFIFSCVHCIFSTTLKGVYCKSVTVSPTQSLLVLAKGE